MKTFLVAATLIIASFFIYKYLGQEQDNNSTHNKPDLLDKKSTIELHENIELISTEQLLTESSEVKKSPSDNNEKMDQYDAKIIQGINEINDWHRKQGYTSMFPLNSSYMSKEENSYEIYSVEELTAMAEVDPIAQLFLGRKLMEIAEYDSAKPHLKNAAVNGYASALTDLYRMHLEQAKLMDKNKKTIDADNMYIEAFAWARVMSLRFDPKNVKGPNSRILRNDKERLELVTINSIERAEELYKDLQSLRIQAGLGEFDNFAPDSLKSH